MDAMQKDLINHARQRMDKIFKDLISLMKIGGFSDGDTLESLFILNMENLSELLECMNATPEDVGRLVTECFMLRERIKAEKANAEG